MAPRRSWTSSHTQRGFRGVFEQGWGRQRAMPASSSSAGEPGLPQPLPGALWGHGQHPAPRSGKGWWQTLSCGHRGLLPSASLAATLSGSTHSPAPSQGRWRPPVWTERLQHLLSAAPGGGAWEGGAWHFLVTSVCVQDAGQTTRPPGRNTAPCAVSELSVLTQARGSSPASSLSWL